MAIPTFVNIGALGSSGSAITSLAAPLPASRVNGNLLIAFFTMNASKVITSVSAGWNLFATQINSQPASLAFAWRFVDGTEAACTFNWTGGHAAQARCLQYSGTDQTSPIGSGTAMDTAGSGNATGVSGVTSSRANSAVAAFITLQIVTTAGTPAGWTQRNNDTLTAAGTNASETLNAGIATLGSNVNGTFGNSGAAWALAQVEILSPNAAATSTIATTLVAPTQSVTVAESDRTTIAQTLSAFTQSITATMLPKGTIDQTFPGITQSLNAIMQPSGTIDQTLPGFVQEFDVRDEFATFIDQHLFGLVQEADVRADPIGTINTTLFAPSQALAAKTVDNTTIDTVLFAPTQVLNAGMRPSAAIDTTLFSPTQIANVVEKFIGAITTPLTGFTQEIDETVAFNTTINTILCARNASATGATATQRSHTGNYIGHSTINASASQAGSLVVAVCEGTFTGSTGGQIIAGGIDNVPGQPAWQRRSHMQGTQPGCAVGFEVWYFISTSAFASTTCFIRWTGGGSLDAFENVCIEYTGVDTERPWDDNSSLPATSQNNSLFFGSNPSISGLSTNAANVKLVNFFAANTTPSPVADAGFTVDAFNQVSSGGHTSATVYEESKNVTSPQSGYTAALGSAGASWVFIADAIRAQQITTAMTQEIDINTYAATIDQTLQTFSQEIDITSFPGGQIAQTLPRMAQEIDVRIDPIASIATTLRAITQENDIHVTLPGNAVAGSIDQTFEGLTQRINVATWDFSIDQTFEGLTQRADVSVEIPTSILDQALFGFTQEIDIVEEMIATVDQTLPGFVQEIDVESYAGTVAQTLPGFVQEIDVIEQMIAFIDQTLQGMSQEDFEGFVEEPPGVIAGNVEGMTLRGFSQEIDVYVNPITSITVELQGMTQRINIRVPVNQHQRAPHAVNMPSKDMPINPHEMDLFRRPGTGRAVDAMVPPTPIANQNLTTSRYPGVRQPFTAIPPARKPR